MESRDGAYDSRLESSMTTLMDQDRKLKRVLANRRYHQKFRMKQLSYVAQLEAKQKSLKAEVITNSVMLNCAVHHNNLLRIENDSIRQKIAAYSSAITFKEAQYELLLQEFQFLEQSIMHQQSQSEMSMNQQPWTEFTPYEEAAAVEAAEPPEAELDQNLISRVDIESVIGINQLCEQKDQEAPTNRDMTAMMSMNGQSPIIGEELNENQSQCFWVDENVMSRQILDEQNLQPQMEMEQTEFRNYLYLNE